MQVKFYNFNKRANSTAVPSGGTAFSVNLLQPSGVISPRLELAGTGNPSDYNYAYIEDFGRYYWVNEWTYDRGLWVADLRVDPLASWREQIGASTQYVLRAAAESNGDIADNVYPTTAQITKQVVEGESPFSVALSQGTYVVCIVGCGGSYNAGTSTYYAMTPAQFAAFADFLMSDDTWVQVSKRKVLAYGVDDRGEIVHDEIDFEQDAWVLKSELNPLQYITSVKWFPFVPTDYGPTTSNIRLGWWDIAMTANVLVSPISVGQHTFNIPAHPQLARGYYLNLPPYSRYTLHFYPWGDIPLDGSYFVKDPTLSIGWSVDLFSGEALLTILSPSSGVRPFATRWTQLGVNIPVSSLNSNMFSAGVNAIGSVAGVAAGLATGNIGGAIQNAASGVMDLMGMALPQMQTSGAMGSVAAFGVPAYITCQFAHVVPNDIADLGAPLCAMRQLSTLPGYQMIAHADIALPATRSEIDQIKSYMEGGYFYE